MSGPRDPSDYERAFLLRAIADNNKTRIKEIIERSKDVVWGAFTGLLGDEQRKVIREALAPEPDQVPTQ